MWVQKKCWLPALGENIFRTKSSNCGCRRRIFREAINIFWQKKSVSANEPGFMERIITKNECRTNKASNPLVPKYELIVLSFFFHHQHRLGRQRQFFVPNRYTIPNSAKVCISSCGTNRFDFFPGPREFRCNIKCHRPTLFRDFLSQKKKKSLFKMDFPEQGRGTPRHKLDLARIHHRRLWIAHRKVLTAPVALLIGKSFSVHVWKFLAGRKKNKKKESHI